MPYDPARNEHGGVPADEIANRGGRPAQEALPTDRMLQFFAYEHLPEHLQAVSKPFCELALHIVLGSSYGPPLPSNPERTVALRKLLESKDCAVRALIYKG